MNSMEGMGFEPISSSHRLYKILKYQYFNGILVEFHSRRPTRVVIFEGDKVYSCLKHTKISSVIIVLVVAELIFSNIILFVFCVFKY
jgi:hypothetical protein